MTQYKEYCRRALEENPKLWSSVYYPDGSLKPPPKIATFGRKKKVLKDIPKNELQKFKKDGWKPRVVEIKKPDLEVTGTEIKIKGHKLNLDILELPKKIDRREYNRIWMHNSRARQRIKELKEKYGNIIPL